MRTVSYYHQLGDIVAVRQSIDIGNYYCGNSNSITYGTIPDCRDWSSQKLCGEAEAQATKRPRRR